MSGRLIPAPKARRVEVAEARDCRRGGGVLASPARGVRVAIESRADETMADKKGGKNGPIAGAEQPGQAAQQTQLQVQIVGQYIKDLSFENPNVDKLVGGIGEQPNLNVEVSVNARPVQEGLFESQIDFKAVANNKIGTIYDLELTYGGMFAIKGLPPEAMEPFLLINCPSLLFPFLRRLVADITREGGFPPLLLDPIDFGSLFMRRQQEMAAAQAAAPKLKS